MRLQLFSGPVAVQRKRPRTSIRRSRSRSLCHSRLGRSVDILARVVGQKLTENWRQPVIIETRPGASTMIGTQAAAKADPDGYTLIIVVSNHATNPAMHATMPYDALKDFEPISLLARAPVVPYKIPSFAPTNMKELVAVARDKPRTINFGSAGPSSMTHLVAEMFKIQADIDMSHVVYRGGTPALNDCSGRASSNDLRHRYASTAAIPIRARARAWGNCRRALCVDTECPHVPRAGVRPHRVGVVWVACTRGTPKPIIAKLNAEMRR